MIHKIFIKLYLFYQKYEEDYDFFFSAVIATSALLSFFVMFLFLSVICIFRLFPSGIGSHILGGVYLLSLIIFTLYFYRQRSKLLNEILNEIHLNNSSSLKHVNYIIVALFLSLFCSLYIIDVCC
jgi:hypothetical protein